MILRKTAIAAVVLSTIVLAGCPSSNDAGSAPSKATARSAPATGTAQLKPTSLQPGELNALRERLRAGGLNQHLDKVRPQNPDTVFKAEPGLAGRHDYVIVLSDEPVAAYRGGIARYAATSPGAQPKTPGYLARNARAYPKLDAKSSAVIAYRSYLGERQDRFVAEAARRGVRVAARQRLSTALNGLVATLSQNEAAQLAKVPGVRLVQRARMLKLNTDTGPRFIGAPAIWDGSATGGTAYQGEGLIAGIVDTGINT
ncbi:MAG: hypothetical protein ACREVL_16005, partial [Solimonas sp.]